MDDTLYEEITFVKSGFRQVAYYLSSKYGLDLQEVYNQLCIVEAERGRGKVFDVVLQSFKLRQASLVRKCVSIYRLHFPTISLYDDALGCLERLRNLGHAIYVVTDGNKIAQGNKIAALQLEKHIKFAFITNRYGLANNKPSPYCFIKICEREKCAPSNVVYIGDNPNKDFVGIKPLGFKTIRLVRGNFKKLALADVFEADRKIYSLNEL